VRQRWASIGGIAVALVLAGCSDPEKQSLCTVYAETFEELGRLVALGESDVTAGEAEDALAEAIDRVQHLANAADNRYIEQIGGLETSLEDMYRVLSSVKDDEDASVWRPLVEDSAEDARFAAAVVADLIEPTCQPTTT
jgi:hypothetical protein